MTFELEPEDRAAIERQLGRTLRGDVRVAVRCACGLPSVIETHPLVDGVPFPTLYWLTCVRARSAVGRLESAGVMQDLNQRLADDPDFREAFDVATRDYVARRDGLHPLEGVGGVGGGPTNRIKCLHAHLAHHLACRCNPVGEWVEERIPGEMADPPCA